MRALAWHHSRQLWSAYRQMPFTARLRVMMRRVLCPFDALLSEFPIRGRILDVGCGDGLLLHLLRCRDGAGPREYVGVDPSEKKIAVARRLGRTDAEFHVGTVETLRSNEYDCVSIVDVLYLLPLSEWTAFLQHCVRVLRPGGLLIVKEVTSDPRWKYWCIYLQELISIKITRMTQGSMPHFESVNVYRRSVDAAGVEIITVRRLDAGRPYAHFLITARKPDTALCS